MGARKKSTRSASTKRNCPGSNEPSPASNEASAASNEAGSRHNLLPVENFPPAPGRLVTGAGVVGIEILSDHQQKASDNEQEVAADQGSVCALRRCLRPHNRPV